jgi:hypothetical protein
MTAHANWRDDAACRDADPELFFQIGTAEPALRRTGEAKRICRAYPDSPKLPVLVTDDGSAAPAAVAAVVEAHGAVLLHPRPARVGQTLSVASSRPDRTALTNSM